MSGREKPGSLEKNLRRLSNSAIPFLYTMKVIISNRLEILADELKKRLFQKGRHPFGRRYVIVPHERILQELYFRWASELQVATGFQMMTEKQALALLFPSIPSFIELSLRIEGTPIEGEPLASYLQDAGRARRASLCDKMSSLFLQYMTREEVNSWLELGGWQQALWRRIFGSELPWKDRQLLEGEVYLFHPFQLSTYQLKAFQEMNTTVFLFSPCAMYWGDLKTAREKQFFLNQTKAREELESYFAEDHPLLANWGRAGREMGKLFEDEEMIDVYEAPSGTSLLATVQEEMLTLTTLDKPLDPSIQIHAVSSKIREVELVWEIIQKLPFEPREILVLAPEMQAYGTLVEMVFRTRGGSFDFAIFGLEAKSPLMQGLQDFIDLPRYRFSKESVEKLLCCPLFLQRFGFDREDAELLKRWISRVQIRYDLKGDHPCTWESGLKRLVEALVLPVQEHHLVIDFSEADLLSRWIGVLQLLSQELEVVSQTMPLSEWIQKVRSWVELFFAPDTELIRQMEKLSVEGVFPFSTIERLLQQIFHQNSGAVHLQAVRFASLEKGALIPAKAIILMGMDEGGLPRKDLPSSLAQLPLTNRNEEDRYLFLEALCSAREQFIITYSHLHPEDGKHQKASPLVEELRRYLNLQVIEHPLVLQSREEPPLTTIPILPPTQLPSWDISLLRLLARHPLQFFFEERLGIDFDWKEQESEFILSPLEISRLRKASLKKPLELLLSEMKEKGKLPVGCFSHAAIEKIKDEIEEYQGAFSKLQVSPQEVYAIELKVSCQHPTRLDEHTWIYPALHLKSGVIQGRIEDLSPQGLLFHGDDSLADLLKVWPLYLVVRQLFPQLPLLLTKKGKVSAISPHPDALERYLLYAEKALTTPSPLIPKWARSILIEGKIPQAEEHDTVTHWVQSRHLLPPEELWLQEWKPYLQEAFRELL